MAGNRALDQQRNAHGHRRRRTMLDDALAAVAEGSDDAVKRLTELTLALAGQPLFCTVAEFDLWMRDPDTVLTLNPNAGWLSRRSRSAQTWLRRRAFVATGLRGS